MYRIRTSGEDGTDRGVLVASPTDLVGHLACPHKTVLDLEVAEGRREAPDLDDAELAFLQRRGLEHERAYLDELARAGLEVAYCDGTDSSATAPGAPAATEAPVTKEPPVATDPPSSDTSPRTCGADPEPTGPPAEPREPLERLRARAEATRNALTRGVDVVYQATFLDDTDPQLWWRGHADFLRRTHDTHPATGAPAYEPEDTKLARHVTPAAVLQLAVYADLLTDLQGVEPEHLHVVLGGRETRSVAYRHAGAYERLARRRFAEFVRTGGGGHYPEPVAHCAVCRWREVCDERRRHDDHLSLVAGLGREQARRLTAAGITTVEALAEVTARPRQAWPAVRGLTPATYERLAHQARLQVAARGRPGPPPYEVLEPSGADRGLEALPPPSPGDLYFDIEGDPWVGDDGLEYLFGIGWWDGEEFAFRAFWGHTPAEERAAFEALVDLVVARRAAHPDLHVYHYAPYEPTALGRLAGRHGTREDEVDDLFRGKVLVDLYRVVRQGLRVGAESYSLKALEPLYLPARTDDIVDAASSVVAYERWLETGDDSILDAIEAYNRTDCESTARLHRWLEDRRAEAEAAFGVPLARPVPPRAGTAGEPDVDEPDDRPGGGAGGVAGAGEPTAAERVAALAGRLLGDADELDGPEHAVDDDAVTEAEARALLAGLLDFHRREDKPAWWRYFARVTGYEEGGLVDDPDCLGDLTYEGIVGEEDRSVLHRYRFDPDQDYRITDTTRVYDPGVERRKLETGEKIPGPGIIVELDPREGVVVLKRGRSSAAPHPRDLMPDEIVATGLLRASIEQIAGWVADRGVDADGSYRAVRDLLLRRPPRIGGVTAGEALRRPGEAVQDAARRLVEGLDESYLPIQGPPGTGKTTTAARVIVELVAAGHRVGITGVSHAVISTLLDKVAALAAEEGVSLRAMQKTADSDQGRRDSAVEVVTENRPVEEAVAADEVDVVGGTAWLFARDALAGCFDHLVIDEAGQFALANVVAVGRAARNLVLVGDPQQLAQPTTGTHPPGVGVSALEHVLAGRATVPDDRGLFLDTTWRMHPDITRFVSELAYDGRLGADPDCARQRIDGEGPLAGSGLRWVPVDHEGNRLSSEEEAEVVHGLYEELVGRYWTGRDGRRRKLGPEDVLVVAPYNAQVHLLSTRLPPQARIGTVDKFQGKEAPVVLVSLAASSVEQIPRGLEFLYSANRLNVAVSRARALAVVVASPALLAAPVRTVEQLRLVNGLCRFAELGAA